MAAKCDAMTAKGRGCGRWALPGTTRCGVHPMAHGDGQPRLDDGSVDVRALCAKWDDRANRGAGGPRESVTLAAPTVGENLEGPGAAETAPDQASTSTQEPT